MNPVPANMVIGPGQYRWWSYRERIGLVNRGLLDLDVSFLAFSDDENKPIECYQAYLKQGASDKAIELLRGAWAKESVNRK